VSGVLYVYAITDSLAAPSATGLHGAPLRRIKSGQLAALASEHPTAPEPDEEVLWAHEQVVEDLMSFATILPLRFGSSVERADDLIAMLAERREEFVDALDRVRGAVELSVRAELPASRPEALPSRPRSGTAYLMERAEQERRGRSAVELVHRPLAALARSSVPPAGTRDPHRFKAAYLVDAERVDDFGRRVGELNATLESTRVSCTGPWPPYSFVVERSE
jgi:Gas vesicle synthesis protein GvpL/GvpF